MLSWWPVRDAKPISIVMPKPNQRMQWALANQIPSKVGQTTLFLNVQISSQFVLKLLLNHLLREEIIGCILLQQGYEQSHL